MLRLFLLSLSASCGNSFLLWPEVPKILAGWNRQCSAPISTGTAQKETHLIPKLNRMPDGSQRVKVSPRNLRPNLPSHIAHRMPNSGFAPRSYPPPNARHRRQVIVQIVNRVQNLRQQLVGSIKMTQIRSRIALTYPAIARRVKRAFILRAPRLLDRNFPFR